MYQSVPWSGFRYVQKSKITYPYYPTPTSNPQQTIGFTVGHSISLVCVFLKILTFMSNVI